MRKYILLLAVAMSGHVFAEDVTSQFSKCAVTTNDKARLACYDRIRDSLVKVDTETSAQPKGYEVIEIDDLKVDIKKLKGKKLSVQAYIQTIGEISMLKNGAMDMSPVYALTDGLPREDRKVLLSKCQSGMCAGKFYGTIKQGPLGLSLAVDHVEWDK